MNELSYFENKMEEAYYISSSPIPYRIVCRLSLSKINELKFGLNIITAESGHRNEFGPILVGILVYKNDDKTLIISRNVCRHAGGNFIRDIEEGPEIVRCTFHGWKLNTKTLEYIKPPNCLKQKQLKIVKQNDEEFILLEESLYEPWLIDIQEKEDLEYNEMKITYINNTCLQIKSGNTKLIIDPWLIGPSFGGSCWLYHQTPSDVFNKIAKADVIFISKYFPDHFNLPTLREIAKINSNIRIYIPDYKIDNFKDQFKKLGFNNVTKVSFGTWQKLNNNEKCLSRFLILPDHKHPDTDCVLLFEYKGHKILHLIDSQIPNGDYLPYTIDVLLSNFTSNTNSFPCCFSEQYDEKEIIEISKKKDENYMKRITKFVQLTDPLLWIPCGNYFIQSKINDQQILDLNWKNDREVVAETLKKRFRSLKTWCPFPGGIYDLSTKILDIPLKSMDYYLNKSFSIQPYLYQLEQSLKFQPLETLEGIRFYYQWTKFNNCDLILHIIEMNYDFSITDREYFIDFIGEKAELIDSCPSYRRYLRIRCRSCVYRDILIHGYSWINLYYGFNGHYFSQPNIYHYQFWNHFKYHLPLNPPEWNEFHQDIIQSPPDILQVLDEWETNNLSTIT